MRKEVLGKGLEALIPKKKKPEEDFVYLSVDEIKPSQFQPRKCFNRKDLAELAQSIKEKGFIQPILVRPDSRGGYEVVAGGRRLEAANLLGRKEIPALIKDFDNKDSFIAAIVENLQRKNLNPLEEAEALERLRREFNFSLDEISQFLSKDKATIANTIRLLKLPDKIKKALEEGLLNRSQARTILSFKGSAAQEKVFYKILQKGLTVRDVEKQAAKKKNQPKINPFIAEAENKLQQILGTKVIISNNKKNKGKIIIQYYSLEDFERIVKKIEPSKGGKSSF